MIYWQGITCIKTCLPSTKLRCQHGKFTLTQKVRLTRHFHPKRGGCPGSDCIYSPQLTYIPPNMGWKGTFIYTYKTWLSQGGGSYIVGLYLGDGRSLTFEPLQKLRPWESGRTSVFRNCTNMRKAIRICQILVMTHDPFEGYVLCTYSASVSFSWSPAAQD